MMRIGLVVAALGALSAVASPADKNDPRETYSTDGWKLAWSKEFNGKVVTACQTPGKHGGEARDKALTPRTRVTLLSIGHSCDEVIQTRYLRRGGAC